MLETTRFYRSKRDLLFASLLWILLWIIPWGKYPAIQEDLYLVFLTDMTKLGIAIGMFIMPGALLFILLQHEPDSFFDLSGLLPIGFALSVTIIAVIGTLGRVFGFSFVFVKGIFVLIGLGGFLALILFKPNFEIRKVYFTEFFRNLFANTPLVLALILAASMTFNGLLFFVDDRTYAAYLTNWQHSTQLGFNNIVHPTGVVEQARFWLALYPMGQALLSDLSGVPGILLLSNYLELFLAPLAVITAYWFACALGLSRRLAGLSVLIQVMLYTMMIDESWPVGFWFFLNLATDKASAVFLLAPVFFVFTILFLKRPAKNTLTLIVLSGIGLTLTHPVGLFLTCAIAAGMALLSWLINETNWWDVLKLIIIFSILILPYAVLRLFDYTSQEPIPFSAENVSGSYQAERYVLVVNDIFYGLNPDVLKFRDILPKSNFYTAYQTFRFFPVVLVLIATVLAISKLRKGALYRYILICILLVGFAAIPYTGWILGYFISARLISRVSWFSPLGLSGALILMAVVVQLKKSSIYEKFVRRFAKSANGPEEAVKIILTSFVFGVIMLMFIALPHAPLYFDVLDHNRQLAQVGGYIDRHTEGWTMVIALDYVDMQMLPGVSANASLISFREEKDFNPHNFFLPLEEIHRRMDASNTIRSLDPSIPTDKRCMFLDEYKVRYVLSEPQNTALFLGLTEACGKKPSLVFKTRDIDLLEFK